MSERLKQELSPSHYIVIISGTHVTGKDTVAASLSTTLHCPLLKGEFAHTSALTTARSQEKRGYDYSTVYRRIWFRKMQKVGLMSQKAELEGGGEPNVKQPRNTDLRCTGIVTIYALRKRGRDAIRDVMLEKSVRVIFVVLQITTDTLVGRTLGAEEPELAKRILGEKAEDLREPSEEERDVLVVDSMQDVDTLTLDIMERIRIQVGEE